MDMQCKEGKIKFTFDPHEFEGIVAWYMGLPDITKALLQYQVEFLKDLLREKAEKGAQ